MNCRFVRVLKGDLEQLNAVFILIVVIIVVNIKLLSMGLIRDYLRRGNITIPTVSAQIWRPLMPTWQPYVEFRLIGPHTNLILWCLLHTMSHSDWQFLISVSEICAWSWCFRTCYISLAIYRLLLFCISSSLMKTDTHTVTLSYLLWQNSQSKSCLSATWASPSSENVGLSTLLLLLYMSVSYSQPPHDHVRADRE